MIFTKHDVMIMTMVLSLIASNDTTDYPPKKMVIMFKRFADSIRSRHFVTTTTTIVMNVGGCC